MTAIALKFQLGARTLAAIPRELVRVSLDLDDVLADRLPALPPLPLGADGWLVTSLPATRLAELTRAAPGVLVHVRQRYVRYHAKLSDGFEAWHGGLSANTRSQLKRKERRIAAASGGTLAISRHRMPDELLAFHAAARVVSATTYQERLMGAGLPVDPGFLLAPAAAGRARGWLLWIGGVPAAYLYGEAQGSALRYDHVGHDPAHGDLSPGSVLMLEAFRDLAAEGTFARFDFTEGEGQHKRSLASAGTPCADVLLLRPTLANRAALMALAGFDRAAAVAKLCAAHLRLKGLAKRVRRAS